MMKKLIDKSFRMPSMPGETKRMEVTKSKSDLLRMKKSKNLRRISLIRAKKLKMGMYLESESRD